MEKRNNFGKNKMDYDNETKIEHYGDLKIIMDNEGDGYFFYGYGLPKEYEDDIELKIKFDEAYAAIDDFKNIVEKRIIDAGGDPSDWIG